MWVKIGPEDGRVKLKVVPADKPHFFLPDIDPNNRKVDSQLVDALIHKAFEISREFAKNVFGHLRRIRSLADEGSIVLTEMSRNHLTYQVQIPRRGFRYFQRPMSPIRFWDIFMIRH